MPKETKKAAEERKLCFVIGPIGGDGTETRDAADWLLYFITPVLEELGFDVTRADKISEPGLISEQVINLAMDADLVIADLTGHNANAFYELAIRHSADKPVVHMFHAGEKPPFDVADFRAISYSRQHPSMMEEALQELRKQVKAVMRPDYNGSNPITRARGTKVLQASADETDQMLAGLLQEVRDLKNRMARVEDIPPEFEEYWTPPLDILTNTERRKKEQKLRDAIAHRRNALAAKTADLNEIALRNAELQHAEELMRKLARGRAGKSATSDDSEDNI